VQKAGEGEILGGMIAPRLRAIAVCLHNDIGISLRKAPRAIEDLFEFRFAPAALIGFEKLLAAAAEPVVDDIRKKVAASDGAMHADETYWTLDGQRAYYWLHATAQYIHFPFDTSRAREVSRDLLGADFAGTLVTDCYSAHDARGARAKQKCLSHLARTPRDWQKLTSPDSADYRFFESVIVSPRSRASSQTPCYDTSMPGLAWHGGIRGASERCRRIDSGVFPRTGKPVAAVHGAQAQGPRAAGHVGLRAQRPAARGPRASAEHCACRIASARVAPPYRLTALPSTLVVARPRKKTGRGTKLIRGPHVYPGPRYNHRSITTRPPGQEGAQRLRSRVLVTDRARGSEVPSRTAGTVGPVLPEEPPGRLEADRAAVNWLWLAIAKQRLGKPQEACRRLNEAQAWPEQYPDGMPARAERELGLHLHNWLEAHVLRREAEVLIPSRDG
jgi:hypothetical protein